MQNSTRVVDERPHAGCCTDGTLRHGVAMATHAQGAARLAVPHRCGTALDNSTVRVHDEDRRPSNHWRCAPAGLMMTMAMPHHAKKTG